MYPCPLLVMSAATILPNPSTELHQTDQLVSHCKYCGNEKNEIPDDSREAGSS